MGSRISYTRNSDDSVELKARVKFQLSAVQETVGSGLAPALESDQVGDEQNSAISAALQEFSGVVDRLNTLFQDDTLSGDDLIARVVNAFNDLTGSAGSELPEEVAPAIAQVDQPAVDGVDEAPPAEILPDAQVPALDIPPVAADADPPAAQPVENVDVADESAPVEEGEVDDPQAIEVNSAEAEIPSASSVTTRRSVLVDLRLNFVQSISQLVTILDSPSADGDTFLASQTVRGHAKLDIRIATYSQTQTVGEDLLGVNVDADA